jgi:urease gamma subunit
MTKRDEEDLLVLENLVASTQKKFDHARKKFGVSKEGVSTRSKGQAIQMPKEAEKTAPEKTGRPEPQYRYVTPIEDPALISKIAKQSLNAPITISTRELFSIAPKIRRNIKDQIITKRVSTGTAAFLETAQEETPDVITVANLMSTDNIMVAKHVEELRVIEVYIQEVKVIATVDDGSQILSIRQDIWEKFGLLIRSDKTMVMESANKTKDETIGLLQDLKITIDGYNFYVQVQVVKEAPYKMLLGRPFFMFTQATHKHYADGESRLTLYDPTLKQ